MPKQSVGVVTWGGGRIILYKTLTYLFSNFCDDQFIKQLISVNNWANEQMTLTYGLQWHQQFIIVDVGYDWCLKSSILTLTVRHFSCCISWGGELLANSSRTFEITAALTLQEGGFWSPLWTKMAIYEPFSYPIESKKFDFSQTLCWLLMPLIPFWGL